MLKVDEAMRLVLNSTEVLPFEEVSLLNSLDRVLARDIYSGLPLPPWDNSAMDGYAVRANDTKYASPNSPCVLEVIGEIKAGEFPECEIIQGKAMRITTGAPLPDGADAVVVLEATEESKDKVKVFKSVTRGENIRKKGEDVREGSLVIEKGKRVRAYEIAMLASLGITKVTVYRTPRVAVITTGDELIDIEEQLPKGKIRDSNSWMLSALLIKTGINPISSGKAADNRNSLVERVKEALTEGLDCLLVSGGVSVGKYDIVKGVLKELGFQEIFHRVKMKPGKPLLFGRINKALVFGLPGNPVSSAISFEVFVRPALFKMMGMEFKPLTVSAILKEDIRKKPGKTHFLRVSLEEEGGILYAVPLKKQGSAMITSLTSADGFIEIDEDTTILKRGETLRVRVLS